MSSGISIEDTPSLFDYLKVKSPSKNPVVYALDKMTHKINVTYSIRANPEDKKWYSSRTEGKVINLIESGLLEDYVSDCKFKNIDKINYNKSCAVVVGSENLGISKFWDTKSDELIKIPMLGSIDSLNVSVSAAIVIYEINRQNDFNR